MNFFLFLYDYFLGVKILGTSGTSILFQNLIEKYSRQEIRHKYWIHIYKIQIGQRLILDFIYRGLLFQIIPSEIKFIKKKKIKFNLIHVHY